MKLISLTIKNFMPYKGIQTIKFPMDGSRNVLVVYGDNMRGKTSILNAIRWGFYQKAYTRHKANISLDKIMNREALNEGDNEFSIEINFEDDKNNYLLTRVATKKKHIIKAGKSDEYEISVFLKKNGNALPVNYIEQEINLFAPEEVSRFFLFDGELLQEYEMLLDEENIKGNEIKSSIEKVLGVPALINGKNECQTLQREAEKRFNKEVAKFESMKQLAENQRILHENQDVKLRDLEVLKAQLKEIKENKASIDDQLEVLSKLSNIASDIHDKTARKKAIEFEQIDIKSEILEISSDAWRDMMRPKLLILEKDIIKKLKENKEIDMVEGGLRKEIDQIEKLLLDKTCPICKITFDENHRHSIEGNLESLKNLLIKQGEINSDTNELTSKLNIITKMLGNSVVERLKDKNRMIRLNEIKITKLENEIFSLEGQLEGNNTNEIIKKRKQHDDLIKTEQSLTDKIDRIEIDLIKIRKQIEDISRQINSNPQASNSKASLLVNVYKELENTFKVSIDNLREKLKVEVESKATEAFLEMTSQKKYRGLSINANYGLTILDENGEEVPLRSAGAEQIVALSLIDGLSRTGRRSGPVVMDTPFGRLDPIHRKNILEYLPKNASQLILLVHEGEIDRKKDLNTLANRLGGEYEITEKSPMYSKLEKIS
jgi:DNA sulfur modification protein DndD